MSRLGQTSQMAKSNFTLHTSLDVSISLVFNIRIVWAARVISSCGMPARFKASRRRSQRGDNEYSYLVQYPPIQVYVCDQG
jgi:hypothetical protein